MAVKDEIKEYVKNTFGDFSAEKIDQFANEFNPDTNKKEFLDKCVNFLATLLGEEKAKEQMSKYY
jgi:hypothetical protein